MSLELVEFAKGNDACRLSFAVGVGVGVSCATVVTGVHLVLGGHVIERLGVPIPHFVAEATLDLDSLARSSVLAFDVGVEAGLGKLLVAGQAEVGVTRLLLFVVDLHVGQLPLLNGFLALPSYDNGGTILG